MVRSSPQKKAVTGDSNAGFVQAEVDAVAERIVHLLQQQRRVRNDESTFSPLAWPGANKGSLTRSHGAIGKGSLLAPGKKL